MKPYKAKSLVSAERAVNRLRKQLFERNDLLDEWNRQRATDFLMKEKAFLTRSMSGEILKD